MFLFKRKSRVDRVDSSKSKVFDKPKLLVGKDIEDERIQEIIKTTDSMKIVSSSYKINNISKIEKLEEVSKTILKSYDLAIRKITNTYDEIIETKRVISNDFLTIQIMINDYEANNNISLVNNLINIFYKEIENQIANGKTVKLHESLIIEPTDYSNKMIPIAHYIPDGFTNVNMISWHEITKILYDASLISSSDIETIKVLIDAIITNIENGYYVKFGNIVIARIRIDSPELMVLFSYETILRINQIYSSERLRKRLKEETKSNYISSFKNSIEKTTDYDKKIIRRIKENEKTGKKRLKDNVKIILKKEETLKEKVDKNILKNKKIIDNKNVSITSIDKKDGKKPIKERIFSKIMSFKKDVPITSDKKQNKKPIQERIFSKIENSEKDVADNKNRGTSKSPKKIVSTKKVADKDNKILNKESSNNKKNSTNKAISATSKSPKKIVSTKKVADKDNKILNKESSSNKKNSTNKAISATSKSPKKIVSTKKVADKDNKILNKESSIDKKNSTNKAISATSKSPKKIVSTKKVADKDNKILNKESSSNKKNSTNKEKSKKVLK